jgi:hypothetical protein
MATKLKIVDGPTAIVAEFMAEVGEVEEVDSPPFPSIRLSAA